MTSHTDSPLLRITDLSVGFQKKDQVHTVLHNISFDLHRNEVLALVGESGSGKSITALSVLGLLPDHAKTTGSIVFDQQSLLPLTPQQWTAIRGKRIAMIFQDPRLALDPVFTVGEQIIETLLAHDVVSSKKEALLRAQSLLELVDIPQAAERLNHYPYQFSGGQCQRIMIAMALACDPELLIADEPTTALDATIQRDILHMLKKLQQQTHIAILMITHDMGVVADIADRVIVLRHGHIEESSDVNSLFEAPKAAYTRELLAAIPHYASSANNHIPTTSNAVYIHQLSIEYRQGKRRFKALDNVSLTLPKGVFTGIVGESGSGKSTLGRTIAGLIKPTSGDIIINDVSIVHGKKADIRQLHQHIGFVFQSPRSALNPVYTIGQSIAEPLEVHTKASKADITKHVDQLLDDVGLNREWRNRYPHELSGGQCQRVAIARALALKPSLLIADEPTSALDVSVQAHILTLLKKLQQEYQFTCLFISHDLTVVSQLCSKVVVLKAGQIVENGSTHQVFEQPENHYTQQLLASVLHPRPRLAMYA